MRQSIDDLFEELPHEDGIASDYHFVKDFPLIANDLEGLFECDIHEDVHSDDDALDLSPSVELDPQLLGHIFVEIGRVALFW